MSELNKINQLVENLNLPQPLVIGLEGGPCGGKTTIIDTLKNITNLQIEILPEVASEKISQLNDMGRSVVDMACNNRSEYRSFQSGILAEIVSRVVNAKIKYEGTNQIIISDRVDIGAYVESDEYNSVLNELGYSVAPYLALIDKVIYLPTLAKINPAKYRLLAKDNPARYEDSIEQAVSTCNRNLLSIADHPELSIYWAGEIVDKTEKIQQEISEPERELEAKFVSDGFYKKEEIQHFLKNRCSLFLSRIAIKQSYHRLNSLEYRLRQITNERGEYIYYYSLKTGKYDERREMRRIIDQDSYQLLSKAEVIGELTKERYRYLFDIIPGSDKCTILAADFYNESGHCVLEVENFNPNAAKDIFLPGFEPSDVSARDLIV